MAKEVVTETKPSNSLFDGEYDEEEQARQFQEALKAWRTGGKTEDKKEDKQPEKKVRFNYNVCSAYGLRARRMTSRRRSAHRMPLRRKRSRKEIASQQKRSLSSMMMGISLLSGMWSSYPLGGIAASAVINLCLPKS